MTKREAERMLYYASQSGLDDVSIENLRLGRVTIQFVRWLTARNKDAGFTGWWSIEDLNAFLEAGRMFPLSEGDIKPPLVAPEHKDSAGIVSACLILCACILIGALSGCASPCRQSIEAPTTRTINIESKAEVVDDEWVMP